MQKTILSIILTLVFAFSGNASNFVGDKGFKEKFKLNRRSKYPAGANLQVLGPIGLVAASFDYFLSPKWAIEIGVGARDFTPNLGFSVGGRYHFFGKTPTNLTPYIGLYSGFSTTENDIQNYNLYVPVGIHKIKRNKLNWSLEIAYQRNADRLEEHFYGGFKLGFRF